jgi:tetratricopeptide (TPR) repeat protein
MKKFLSLTAIVGLLSTAQISAQDIPDTLTFKGKEQYYLQELQKDTSNANSYARLGDVYLEVENFPKALEYFNKALQRDQNLVQAYAGRGEALVESQNNPLQGVADLRKALSAGKSFDAKKKAKLHILIAEGYNLLSSDMSDDFAALRYEHLVLANAADSLNPRTQFDMSLYLFEKEFYIEAMEKSQLAYRLDSLQAVTQGQEQDKMIVNEAKHMKKYVDRKYNTPEKIDAYYQRNFNVVKKNK